MSSHEASQAEKRLKALKITFAYAEYKMRQTGDLSAELANWTDNIRRFIRKETEKKQAQ